MIERESLLNTQKDNYLAVLKSIPEDSVCHKYQKELIYDIEKKLKQTEEFKELVAIQEMPELLATKLTDATNDLEDNKIVASV